MPFEQAGFGGEASGQLDAVPHWPANEHVCVDVVVAHCFDPGTHVPPHELPTQAYMQVLGVPHVPSELQV